MFRTARIALTAALAALAFAAPAAHAEGGPAAQPTTPEEVYLASLKEALAEAREEERAGTAACNAAVLQFKEHLPSLVAAVVKLDRLSRNPLLAEAQRAYRDVLRAQLDAAVAQTNEAKQAALAEGKRRAEATAKILVLNTEISRLDGSIAALRAAEKTDTAAGPWAKSYRSRNASPASLGTSIDVPQPVGLPWEFAQCVAAPAPR